MTTRLGIRSMGFALAALALAEGCGGGGDAMNKQLAELQAQLIKVRADNAVLTDRLDAMELSRDGYRVAAPGDPAPAAARSTLEPTSGPAPDRPALEVVRLAPESDGDRPVLRSVGGGVVVDGDPGAPPAGNNPPTPSRRKP